MPHSMTSVPPVPLPPSVPVIPEGTDLRLYSLPTQETQRRLDVVTGILLLPSLNSFPVYIAFFFLSLDLTFS